MQFVYVAKIAPGVFKKANTYTCYIRNLFDPGPVEGTVRMYLPAAVFHRLPDLRTALTIWIGRQSGAAKLEVAWQLNKANPIAGLRTALEIELREAVEKSFYYGEIEFVYLHGPTWESDLEESAVRQFLKDKGLNHAELLPD